MKEREEVRKRSLARMDGLILPIICIIKNLVYAHKVNN